MGKTYAHSITKYQKAHYTKISINIKKDIAQRFEEKLIQDGRQKTEFLREKIIEYIEERE